MRTIGTVVRGVRAPIIREGDNIAEVAAASVMEAWKEAGIEPRDRDVVAVTESVVARAQGNYATLDQIAKDVREKTGGGTVGVAFPILSRNRFSLLLRGMAMGCKKIVLLLSYPSDEVGNFVNGIGVGFIVTAFYDPIAAHFGPAEALGLPVQLLWVALAVPVTALGASLYQTADLGIAPYDYLSLGLRDYTPVPYFGCRVFTDALCALLCWLLGGLVGIGTLICAFCLGPFIQFFNGLVSERVLHYKPGGQ